MGVLALPVKIRASNTPKSHSAPRASSSPQSNSSDTTSTHGKIKDYGIALIQNIMNKQVVDLESTL
jgi:hypothetical protein